MINRTCRKHLINLEIFGMLYLDLICIHKEFSILLKIMGGGGGGGVGVVGCKLPGKFSCKFYWIPSDYYIKVKKFCLRFIKQMKMVSL